MQSPGRLALYADRNTTFRRFLIFEGLDLTGATFAGQVRLLPGTPGTALVSLTTTVTEGLPGFRLVSALEIEGVMTSTVEMRIAKATMQSLPAGDETGDDVTLAWDMIITPSGDIDQRYIGGDFIVREGTTVP